MKLVRILGVIGVIGALGVTTLMAGDVAAEINDKIDLLGDEFQIAVHPVYIEFDLIPGSTTGEKYRVRNVGSEETTLKIGVASRSFSSDTTVLGTPRNEIVDWTTVTLEPGCEATKTGKGVVFVHMRVKEECFVRFSTKTPSNAPFGEQYMNIYFQEVREDEGDLQGIRSIGANVFGTNRTGASKGAGDMCAKVLKQEIPFWLLEGPLATSALVENCGRLNFHATIQIEVRNLFGGLVYEEARANDRIIIAESQRELRDAWSEAGIGLYRTKQTVIALGETYVYEGWTFIIPIWLIILILSCILVAILVGVYDRKRKKLKKAGGK